MRAERKLRTLFYRRFIVPQLPIIGAALLLQCAALSKSNVVSDGAEGGFAAYGDITVAASGERYRARIDIARTAEGNLACTFYDPFGATMAVMYAGIDSARLEMGDRVYTGRADALPDDIPYFRNFPFTIGQAARILCGQPLIDSISNVPPDSTWTDKRMEWKTWVTGDLRVSQGAAKGRPESQTVWEPVTGAVWNVTMTRFTAHCARDIVVRFGDNNYFHCSLKPVR